MKIPLFHSTKERFFLEFFTVLNPFYFKLNKKPLLLLAKLAYQYYILKEQGSEPNNIWKYLLSDEFLKPLIKNKTFTKNEVDTSIKILTEKKLLVNGKLKDYLCINPMKDNIIELKWEISDVK